MKEFSKWLQSANEVLSIWYEFSKDGRLRSREEVDAIIIRCSWNFPADIVRLKNEVRLMGSDARLMEIASELSESVGKVHESVWQGELQEIFSNAENMEFSSNQKRAYFFGYGDNDECVNELNIQLADLFSIFSASLLNLKNTCEAMFRKRPYKRAAYRCDYPDILEKIRVFFFDNDAHDLSKTKFSKIVCSADLSSIFGTKEGNKAKIKYMINCISPLFQKEWYRDAAQSIGFSPTECSGANVSYTIKNGWDSTKTTCLMNKQRK